MVQPTCHTFTRVDVPTRRAFEPAALREAEAPAVALALERYLGDDGVGSHHFQVEARLEHVVDEAELHERWLEQHAAIFELREQLCGVLSANVHGGVTRIA